MYTVRLQRGPRDKHGLWATPAETRYHGPDKAEAVRVFNASRHVSMAREALLIEHASDGDYRLRHWQLVNGQTYQTEVRRKLA